MRAFLSRQSLLSEVQRAPLLRSCQIPSCAAKLPCPQGPARYPSQSSRRADVAGERVGSSASMENGAHAPAEVLRVKKLSAQATLPVRGSSGAAGYDLSSAEDTVVPARGKAIVKTDLQIGIPDGTYARIAPRSGLAAKHSIDVGAGVVDYDYRGNVGVILFNFSDNDFKISVGDRIAQLILERILTPPVQEVDELDSTQRAAGGFGSTGVAAK